MIVKFWRAFVRIANYDRIPKLPRGMLANRYEAEDITPIARRLMARFGIRDPSGISAAMKRYGVQSPEELLAVLEHQQPPRRILERFWQGLGRLTNGTEQPPHEEEIKRIARRKTNGRLIEIQQRVYNAQKALEDE